MIQSFGRLSAIGFAGLLLFLVWAPGPDPRTQDARSVFVTNFPRKQVIEGEVTLAKPILFARPEIKRDILVSPVPRRETTRYVDAGSLETDGFSSIVLSLHGQVRGSVARPGDIGVILLPDEPRILEAFNERGEFAFGIESVAAEVSSGQAYFASRQSENAIAFPRYRIFLYNGTDKSVNLDLFAYLTN